MSLYLAALFVALTPGVLVTLPKGGSKYTVLAVHSILFVVVWHFTNKIVWSMTMESFQNNGMNTGVNTGMNTGVNTGMNTGVNNSGMNNSGMNTVVNNSGMANSEGFERRMRN